MRVVALTRFRLAGAVRARTLLAPLVTLVALLLISLTGAGAPAPVSLTTVLALAFPVLSWVARQVLDAEPDEQDHLSALAVGGRRRADAAGLLAAYAVVLPLGLLGLAYGAFKADEDGVSRMVALAGLGLTPAFALAAVAVGALAARRTVGTGAGPVVVLVGVPVLTAALGASRSPVAAALVPPLGRALRAAYSDSLVSAAPGIALQVVLWSVLVLSLRRGARLVNR